MLVKANSYLFTQDSAGFLYYKYGIELKGISSDAINNTVHAPETGRLQGRCIFAHTCALHFYFIIYCTCKFTVSFIHNCTLAS